MNKQLLSIFTLFLTLQLAAQQTWVPNPETNPAFPSSEVILDMDQMKSALATNQSTLLRGVQAVQTVSLPLPTGETIEVSVFEDPIMADELSAKYPEIRSFKVVGEKVSGRIGLSYKGFDGMLFTSKGTVYIDRIEGDSYRSYYRKDFMEHTPNKGHQCLVDDAAIIPVEHAQRGGSRSGETLRTYRLALACTGEYAQFHGGTKPQVLSAMHTTMNRVNGVYERDFAVKMEIIAGNDTLIQLNAATDPYTNNSGFTMLGQNQFVVDQVIGTANYDIGHVFSTGGGGIASLASVCTSSNKARGVTGGNSPVGDPFDIDYVAHEMGHQFGGNHTQNNNCNRVSSAAYEPGSASTIMGYAGICAPNLQNNSDDYFHAHSYDEIISNVTFGTGSNCPVETNTNNSAPVVTVGSGGFSIPKETPFELDGSATDVDGDDLLYCWEQMDLGPSSHPSSPSGNAPIFRSWDPREYTHRTFPREVSVITGSLPIGETYPTYARDLNFRLTVRDDNVAGGGVSYDEISFEVDGESGPFVVTSPNAGEQVETGNGYEVTWDVAGTDQSPVNCSHVHIELVKYSAGQFVVIDSTEMFTTNDGSEIVHFPTSLSGGGYYVRVRAANNVFFNINGGAFSLTAPSAPEDFGITLDLVPDYTNSLVHLTWTDSFSNENAFMIERSLGDNQSFVLIDSVGANDTTYTDSSAVMTGNNYYRVYASNAGGQSDYSNEATYDPLSITELDNGRWIIYPNPTTGLLAFNGLQDQAGKAVDVTVFDQSGRMVASFANTSLAGTIDISGLAAGFYVVELKQDMVTQQFKIELTK